MTILPQQVITCAQPKPKQPFIKLTKHFEVKPPMFHGKIADDNDATVNV